MGYTYSLWHGVQEHKTFTKRIFAGVMALLFAGSIAAAMSASAATTYEQGFETDKTDWSAGVTRVSSDTNEITSSDGDFHATAAAGSFTRWGGYETVFPENGYVTELDLYIDTTLATDGTDKRLDFSSAISTPDGDHRRDFILHLGTNPAVEGEWLASASNNSPGWPGDPARNPVPITETGWYTLTHEFNNVAGVLSVDVSVVDDTGATVGSWTLSNTSDVIGDTVGGNRYGWIVNHDFGTVAIDNAVKTEVDAVDEIAPEVAVTNPTEGQELRGVVSLEGTVVDESEADFRFAVRNSDNDVVLNSRFQDVPENDLVAWEFDTAAFPDGDYRVVLTGKDEAGNSARSVAGFSIDNVAEVKNDCKNGGFALYEFKNQGQCVASVVSNENSAVRGRN